MPMGALFARLCILQESQHCTSHTIKVCLFQGECSFSLCHRHTEVKYVLEQKQTPMPRKKGVFLCSGKDVHPETDSCHPAKHLLVEANVFSLFSEVSMIRFSREYFILKKNPEQILAPAS